jgi:hypothetical protein
VSISAGLFASERLGVMHQHHTPSRSHQYVIVSLTPPTTLNQEPPGKTFIATNDAAPTVKQHDA